MRIKLLTETAVVPSRATDGSAGYDLCADEDMLVRAGGRRLVSTGVAMAIPHGYEGQVRPRSGLAYKHGVTVLNSPGTIDSDYRGEVKVLLHNTAPTDFTVRRGMRIAQIVFAKHEQPAFFITDGDLPDTTRKGGFGHTGM